MVPGLVRLVLRFDIKDTSNDEEIIADAFQLEEGYEQRFVQKMSEVLDPNEFLKMMSLIELSGITWKYCPNKATETADRSPATVRRYLKALRESGFVEIYCER